MAGDAVPVDARRSAVPVRRIDRDLASALMRPGTVKPSVKPKTYTTYDSLCRTAIVPRIGRKHLAKLTELDL